MQHIDRIRFVLKNHFGRFSGTEFWLVATMTDTNRDMMSATLEGIRGFMRDCMEGSVERGHPARMRRIREGYGPKSSGFP